MSTQVKERYSRLDFLSRRSSVRAVRLKPAEIAAIAVAVGMLALVSFYYFSSLKPARQRTQEAKTRFDRQQEVLAGATIVQGSGQTSRSEQVQRAKESIESFKLERLRSLDQGRTAIFDQINLLVKKNNVQLTSGIEMGKVTESQARADNKKDVEDMLDVFPKRQVQFTVVGPYPNLRALINSLEHSTQFVMIDTISLASVDEAEAGRVSRRGRSAPVGSSVSLTIGMTAYFRL